MLVAPDNIRRKVNQVIFESFGIDGKYLNLKMTFQGEKKNMIERDDITKMHMKG